LNGDAVTITDPTAPAQMSLTAVDVDALLERTPEGIVPRIAADATLLQMTGPPSALPAPIAALCAVLTEASDLLGMRIDAGGDVQDLFVCRQLDAHACLAAMFDGQWVAHGWCGLDRPASSADAADLHQVDDDATHSGLVGN